MNNHLNMFSLVLLLNVLAISAERQVYIVYMGEHSGEKTFQEIEDLHHSYMHSVKRSKEEAKASILHSYKNVINGFSAFLTPEEADTISEMDGVISVFYSDKMLRPQTTRSWDFISLLEADWNSKKANGEELLRKASYGKNVIVGVFDTGIWPEHESFNDEGMEAVPTSWKGICQSGVAFDSSNCNRKLIGARYYLKGYEAIFGSLDPNLDFRSPRAISGHGTHVSSIIGGRRVPNAAVVGGYGNGTATGGAPLVRLAIYKVCWPIPGRPGSASCMEDDMLAAFDDAIADGVDVISVSIGRNSSRPYSKEIIAIGALHAIKQNILVSCSAGNYGPDPYSVSNVAPWIITVGAGSIDRIFSSPVVLGNGRVVQGQSITPFQRRTYPLISVGDGQCRIGTLPPPLVRGKAVFCRRRESSALFEVTRAGGAAAVLGNEFDGIGITAIRFWIPGIVVFSNETNRIYNYSLTDQTAIATFMPPITLIGNTPAPFMAPFTSRGPNFIQPNILKPDITAPGLNILAAWSEESDPSEKPPDGRIVRFEIGSGTSMSCPHVSAVAALLKAIHPSWSSAAIRSALMTTAKLTNNLGNPIADALGNPATPFEYGAGHIQPSKAADPGLVYDASYTDYLLFLCSSSDNSLDPSFNCPSVVPSANQLNYPSLAIANLRGSLTVTRTVTNVGTGKSYYSVKIHRPSGYSVRISPARLSFRAPGEKLSFNITIRAESRAKKNVFAFGWYTWIDGIHQVRSPIAVSTACE